MILKFAQNFHYHTLIIVQIIRFDNSTVILLIISKFNLIGVATPPFPTVQTMIISHLLLIN